MTDAEAALRKALLDVLLAVTGADYGAQVLRS